VRGHDDAASVRSAGPCPGACLIQVIAADSHPLDNLRVLEYLREALDLAP
jgi:hypothetical protein